MLDLIYWLGQIALVELELIVMITILVLPALWIIGSIVELLYRATYKLKVYKMLIEKQHYIDGAEMIEVKQNESNT